MHGVAHCWTGLSQRIVTQILKINDGIRVGKDFRILEFLKQNCKRKYQLLGYN